MLYINNVKQIKGFPFGTITKMMKSEFAICSERPKSTIGGNIIHLVHSMIFRESLDQNQPIQHFRSISISFDLKKRFFYGPTNLGEHSARDVEEITSFIHQQCFIKRLRQSSDFDEQGLQMQSDFGKTLIIGKLYSIEEYLTLWDLFNQIRILRIQNRAKNPRFGDQKFKDDNLDAAITSIKKPLDGIMTRLLTLGRLDEIEPF